MIIFKSIYINQILIYLIMYLMYWFDRFLINQYVYILNIDIKMHNKMQIEYILYMKISFENLFTEG